MLPRPVRRQLHRARAHVEHRRLGPTARAVRDRHLTYLRPDRLQLLERLAKEVNRARVPGDFLECGLALGGSAAVLATSRGPGRAFLGYDVFGMIPAPSEKDPPAVHERYAVIASGRSAGIGGEDYYGYRADLKEHVAGVLASFGHPVGDDVVLHEGLFDDTLRPTAPVALAHIDADWHDPVDTCLRRIEPQLSPGGYMVLDDYDDYGGCATATDAFLAEHPELELRRFRSNVAVHRPRAA